jgi:hypothetical protein
MLPRLPRTDRASAKLAAAVKVLFAAAEREVAPSLDEVWAQIEAAVPRSELAAALQAQRRCHPLDGADQQAHLVATMEQGDGVGAEKPVPPVTSTRIAAPQVNSAQELEPGGEVYADCWPFDPLGGSNDMSFTIGTGRSSAGTRRPNGGCRGCAGCHARLPR